MGIWVKLEKALENSSSVGTYAHVGCYTIIHSEVTDLLKSKMQNENVRRNRDGKEFLLIFISNQLTTVTQ